MERLHPLEGAPVREVLGGGRVARQETVLEAGQVTGELRRAGVPATRP
ncbi:hypothetical protein HDC93_003968 [Streptomyces sp. AK010]|nr:hypothetical protein [Streptomyces sp. AK010]